MIAAITGLMQSGKSTLFAALSGREPAPPGYAGVTESIVNVPDGRFEWLIDYYNPEKVTYATIDCLDLPGFDFDDEKGRSMARKIFNRVRLADLLVLVVQAYEPRPDMKENILRDVNTLLTEYLLSDLEIVTNRVERLEKEVLKATKFQDQKKEELDIQRRLLTHLESERPVSEASLRPREIEVIKSLGLLTMKPAMVIINTGEADPAGHFDLSSSIGSGIPVISVCARLEQEISLLDEASRAEFIKELGLGESALSVFVGTAYKAMGLISFLTVGEDEVRAWPVREGTIAHDAAGKVHSDIKRGFIRAETMAYDELKGLGSEKAMKAAGKIRLEGKDYIVRDGDIISYRFNV
ncbi:MAG: redox-regulated ATPase YchF [Candidatus Krumholzibacteriota bacterium]|nr:redox-regulated ATPase YchF [Candidatus Krumholzibacteriota bacterium]